MAAYLQRIWSSEYPLPTNPIRQGQEFKYYLTAIRYRSSIKAELVCCTYGDGPTIGYARTDYTKPNNLIQALHNSILSQASWECTPGQFSVWKDKPADITVFVEVLPLQEINAGLYGLIKDLIHLYKTGRDLPGEADIEDSVREKEVRNFTCSLFVHYWFIKDVTLTPYPGLNVHNATGRADVAEAHGFRAFQTIDAFFREGKFGGK